jgi:hypothetical protein
LRRGRHIRGRSSRTLTRLGAILAALALLSQSLALAVPAMPVARDARAAQTELSALLGPGVVVCAQADDPGAPAPPDCHDTCPLCQGLAHAVLFDAPTPVLLQTPPFALSETLGVRPPVRGPPPPPLAFALARGPPSLT